MVIRGPLLLHPEMLLFHLFAWLTLVSSLGDTFPISLQTLVFFFFHSTKLYLALYYVLLFIVCFPH